MRRLCFCRFFHTPINKPRCRLKSRASLSIGRFRARVYREVDDSLEAPGLPLEDQVQEDPLLLLLEEDAVEEVDEIELSEISPVAKRRKKYVIEDSDNE